MKVLEKIAQKMEHSLAPMHSFFLHGLKRKSSFVCCALFFYALCLSHFTKKDVSLEKLRLPFFYCVADMEIWILLVCVSTTTIKMCKGGRKCGTVLFLQSTIRLSDLSSHEPD